MNLDKYHSCKQAYGSVAGGQFLQKPLPTQQHQNKPPSVQSYSGQNHLLSPTNIYKTQGPNNYSSQASLSGYKPQHATFNQKQSMVNPTQGHKGSFANNSNALQQFNQSYLNKLSNLETKSKCYSHQYLNEFYCLECARDICSHCLLLPNSPHQGHKNVQIKDHLRKVQSQNKENAKYLDQVRKKFGKPSKANHAQEIIEEKQKELSESIDQKIEGTINKLRTLQDEVKRRYGDLIHSNIDQIEAQQNKIQLDATKNKVLAKTLQKALEQQDIGVVITQNQTLEDSLQSMHNQIKNYETLKKDCQDKREQYKLDAEKGTEEILQAINDKVKAVNEILDIPRYKHFELLNSPSNFDSPRELQLLESLLNPETSKKQNPPRSQSAKLDQSKQKQKEPLKFEKIIIQLQKEQQKTRQDIKNNIMADFQLQKFASSNSNNQPVTSTKSTTHYDTNEYKKEQQSRRLSMHSYQVNSQLSSYQ
ncbi:ring zinc finger-containing protein [Stylonychia lemnae]|uniref:Ring zinc finger-containing protein n=1 Tax=Stylonychia lemnae TaxID=5949 RepID=A0A078A6R4_STYLE|nr:ring zinc finger-containing protein [Stylonychia lemnae]|eukprot:CDW77581.1 ring zinc finger-containing protein [Stylonychia lemnae]